jgi:hypothetical protein
VVRSTTILATFVLGAMLAAGSATVSMARIGGDGHAIDLTGGGIHIHKRKLDHRHDRDFFSDGGYGYQSWWNYDTDGAYCSFDAVDPSYYGANGIWHSCL